MIGYQLAVTLLQPPWSGLVTDWLRAALAWPQFLVVAYVGWWLCRARRPEAPSWWMFSAALLSYAIARTWWTVDNVVVHPHGVPFPSLPDLFFALQYPFFFLAVILIPRTRLVTPRVIVILEVLLWMGAATALSWYFMLAPTFAESGLSPFAREVSLSYLVGDLFVLFGLTVTLLRPSRHQVDRPVVAMLTWAFACLILGDSWAIWVLLYPAHVYRTGGFPDLFWVAFYLLVPLAALSQLRVVQREPPHTWDAPADEPGRRGLLWQDFRASLRLFLPIVAGLLASAAITIRATVRAAESGWKGVIWPILVSFVLLLLITLRQEIICLENARLRREGEVARVREQALLELQRRKDEFLGVVSHEIRTPLAIAQGYIQLLARRFDSWRPQEDAAAGAAGVSGLARAVAVARTMLGHCEESLRRLTRLSDDLVDDARIRDGRLALRLAPCDLGPIVRAAVEEQRMVAPDRAIRLHVPAGRGPFLVEADADRIGQVVANYLTNALKYSQGDRPVEVRLEVEGDARGGGEGGVVRVSVRDEGPGLPPAAQARVWERFPQIEGVVVRSGSGVSLGLGLHICKAVVEGHRGGVGVESAEGRGSTFWFALPLVCPRIHRSEGVIQGSEAAR